VDHQPRSIAGPEVSPETEAFWTGAQEGRLLLGRCNKCGEVYYYPRALCPFCLSADTGLEQALGRGQIYSFSIMRAAPIPYVIALVTLAEGVTLMTNIVGCDPEQLAIGQPVRVIFEPSDDGQLVPMFMLDN
jgi:uncharacterized OB-fold protein